MYICTSNCTTMGYARLHASIAGKQAQLLQFSRIIKIHIIPMGSCIDLLNIEYDVSVAGNDVHDQEMMYMIMKIIIVHLSGSMI